MRGTGGLRRTHQPLSSARARSSTSFWAARPTTRRAKRSTRWPACSAWAIPAVPRSSERPRGGNPAAFAFPAVVPARRAADLEFLRPEDGGSLRLARPECTREVRARPEPRADQRPGGELPGSGRRRHRGQDPPGAGADGHEAAGSRRRRRREFPASRSESARWPPRSASKLFIPPLALCTDNAAMAGIALPKLAAGQVASLDVDVTAGLVRPGRALIVLRSRPIVTRRLGTGKPQLASVWSRRGRTADLAKRRCCASSDWRRSSACSWSAGIDRVRRVRMTRGAGADEFVHVRLPLSIELMRENRTVEYSFSDFLPIMSIQTAQSGILRIFTDRDRCGSRIAGLARATEAKTEEHR